MCKGAIVVINLGALWHFIVYQTSQIPTWRRILYYRPSNKWQHLHFLGSSKQMIYLILELEIILALLSTSTSWPSSKMSNTLMSSFSYKRTFRWYPSAQWQTSPVWSPLPALSASVMATPLMPFRLSACWAGPAGDGRVWRTHSMSQNGMCLMFHWHLDIFIMLNHQTRGGRHLVTAAMPRSCCY